MSKKIWLYALFYPGAIACSIKYMMIENWTSLCWCISCSLFVLVLLLTEMSNHKLEKQIESFRETLRRKNSHITKLYGSNEAMTANCDRYLKEITELKKRLKHYEFTDRRED